jgi:hypothetical protein
MLINGLESGILVEQWSNNIPIRRRQQDWSNEVRRSEFSCGNGFRVMRYLFTGMA